MAEDRTPHWTSLTDRAEREPEAEHPKRERHRRHRDDPDRREPPASNDRRFPGRKEHEGAVSKLL